MSVVRLFRDAAGSVYRWRFLLLLLSGVVGGVGGIGGRDELGGFVSCLSDGRGGELVLEIY